MRLSGTVMKAVGIAFVLIGALLVARTLLFKNAPETPDAGEKVQTVLDVNHVEIPEIDWETCTEFAIEINDGKPFFEDGEIAKAKNQGYFVALSECDNLKRTQTALMCADEEHRVKEPRSEEAPSYEPSGWRKNAIYENTYLLKWELCNTDDITNVITGTEFFNSVVRPEYEEQVVDYVRANPDKHVLYRVTPYYTGNDLVAKGILMEAYSIEDDGAFSMCEFLYNVQPGTEVVYETGVYHMHETWQEALAK